MWLIDCTTFATIPSFVWRCSSRPMFVKAGLAIIVKDASSEWIVSMVMAMVRNKRLQPGN